jgi:hypothetical protein
VFREASSDCKEDFLERIILKCATAFSGTIRKGENALKYIIKKEDTI